MTRFCLYPASQSYPKGFVCTLTWELQGLGEWECVLGVGESFLKEPLKMTMQVWRSPRSPAWPSPQGPVRLGRKDPLKEKSPGHRGDEASGTPSRG